MKAKVGWQARTLAIVACALIMLIARVEHRWWMLLIVGVLSLAAVQMALNSAYFIGQAHVHQDRVDRLIEAEIKAFLESRDDD